MALRRPGAAAAAVATPEEDLNFLSLDFYAEGGFDIPEGDYALEFDVRNHQIINNQGVKMGEPTLGIMVTFYPLAGGDPLQKHLGMGKKAIASYSPDPDNNKKLKKVPGGPPYTLSTKTNWAIFLKSMYDCGLPVGRVGNDVSELDGMHAHIQSIPEPEERKEMGAKTGEVQQQQRKGPGKIPVVTEIKEDGKPWEGTGGIPTIEAPAKKPTKPVAAAKPPVKPVGVKKPTAPAPEPEEVEEGEMTDEDVAAAAQDAIGSVLSIAANAPGLLKLKLRQETFKVLTESHGEEMASGILDATFGVDDALATILGELGYKVSGPKVVPA